MAGNDTEGLRYGTIETPEKYYLRGRRTRRGPFARRPNLLDRHLLQLCSKARFLELIHDFIVFDAGIKKLCRHNQYFGVRPRRNTSSAARGRHHLAHPGQRQEPDHGVAGQVDPREP
jgi:type I restriction enzyme R subunit